jgi:hypothetical protein
VYQTTGVAWFDRLTPIGTSNHLRDYSSQIIGETLMPRPSKKMRELRTALALALGLAIVAFGTAIVAAPYIAK